MLNIIAIMVKGIFANKIFLCNSSITLAVLIIMLASYIQFGNLDNPVTKEAEKIIEEEIKLQNDSNDQEDHDNKDEQHK